MNRIVVAIAATIIGALVGACEKSSKTTDTTAAAPAASASPVASVKAEEPPTVTDFEEEAASQITAENADQELDSLEKEISQ